MKPLDRLSEYLGAIERRLAAARADARRGGDGRGSPGPHRGGRGGGQPVRVFERQRGRRAGSPVSWAGARAGGRADRARDPAQPPSCRARGRAQVSRSSRNACSPSAERMDQSPNDPFLPLLADDTLELAHQAQPQRWPKTPWIFSFSSAAVVAVLALIWLGMSGPGLPRLRHFAALGRHAQGRDRSPFTPSRSSPATTPSASAPTS